MRAPISFLCCIAFASCAPEQSSNPEQAAFYEQWANKNVTDAQIQAWQRAAPRDVKDWRATVTNVREDGNYTIIDTTFRNQTYELWIFEPEAREKARGLYAKTAVSFSGDLLAEKSLTHKGARENPEFGVYASRVAGGGVEVTQTSEGIARQHQGDAQAADRSREEYEAERRDTQNAERSVAYCRELVAKKLKFPVGADFSWFQARTQKESDTRWSYTDVVTSITASGSKVSTRFVCTATVKAESIDGQVKFLK